MCTRVCVCLCVYVCVSGGAGETCVYTCISLWLCPLCAPCMSLDLGVFLALGISPCEHVWMRLSRQYFNAGVIFECQAPALCWFSRPLNEWVLCVRPEPSGCLLWVRWSVGVFRSKESWQGLRKGSMGTGWPVSRWPPGRHQLDPGLKFFPTFTCHSF